MIDCDICGFPTGVVTSMGVYPTMLVCVECKHRYYRRMNKHELALSHLNKFKKMASSDSGNSSKIVPEADISDVQSRPDNFHDDTVGNNQLKLKL